MTSANNCIVKFSTQPILTFVASVVFNIWSIIAHFMIDTINTIIITTKKFKFIAKTKFGKCKKVRDILMSNSCRRVKQMQQKSFSGRYLNGTSYKYCHWHCQSNNICCCNLPLRAESFSKKKWINFLTLAKEYGVMMRV